MWIRRTSRGRRDFPLSLSEVEGICAGWCAGVVAAFAGVAAGADAGWGAGACDEEAFALAGLLEDGSVGGVRGCVGGGAVVCD